MGKYCKTTWAALRAALAPPDKRVVPADTYKAATKSLANGPFIGSYKYLKQQLRADRDGADPRIIRFEQAYIKLAREYNVPLFATEVLRSPARQNELFDQGHSKARAGSSPHQYGLAVDVVHGVRAWDLTRHEWAIMGQIGKEAARKANVKIEWGGDWSFYDPAHWQIADWADLVPDFD